MIGIAYEVAAILDKEVILPKPQVETEKDDHVENYITVHSEAPDACPHYLAYVIKDVEIKPSPMWMQNYLLTAGMVRSTTSSTSRTTCCLNMGNRCMRSITIY